MAKFFQKHSIKIFVITSLLVHVAIVSSTYLKELLFSMDIAFKKDKIIELMLLPEEQLQIVDKQKVVNEEEPLNTRFLSEKNNKVDEQSKLKPAPLKKQSTPQKKKQKLAQERKLKDKGELPTLDKFRVKLDEVEEISKRLTPPSANDYLKDIPEKDRTALSTKEFLFFSYYERIKKRVGMFWTPALERKFRKLYFANIELDNRDLTTKLIIVLDEEGNIKKIENMRSSGFKELDEAAIEAFRRAAPFLNPPKGILDDENNLIIRWDFILKSHNQRSKRYFVSKK